MLRSFTDLLGNVLDRAEEETGLDQSEFVGLATDFLDRAYFEILNRRAWMWSRAPAPFPLRVFAPIPTTVDWAQGSYVLSLPVSITGPVDHWKLMIRGQAYRIARRFDAMNLQMELPWPEASLVDEPVTAFKDQYTLLEIPDVPPAPTIFSITQPGFVPPGTYSYSMTYIGSTGETVRSPGVLVTLPVESKVVLLLPPHPAGNPYVIGMGLYRAFVRDTDPPTAEYPGLITRLYPSVFDFAGPVPVVDDRPGPLPPDAPLAFGDNGTVRVRLIYGVYPRGGLREVDPMSEIKLREAFHDPTAQRWPPLAYARTSQNILTLSHQPTQAGVLDVFHTEIGKPLSLCTVNEIRVPQHFRHVLADAALATLLEQKHSDRAAVWAGRIKDHLLVMEAEDEKVKHGYDSLRRGTRHETVR